jgi:hypothetical protein
MVANIRMTAMALVASVTLSVVAPMAAQAGSKGSRNTAIGLGALAVYGVARRKPLIAGLAGGGAVYSYMRSRKQAKRERSRRHFARSRYHSSRYYRYSRR